MSFKHKIKEWLKAMDKYSPYPMFYATVMYKEERKRFHRIIKNASVFLEFGMGGTTFRVLKRSRALIHSVDSSEDWIAYLRAFRLIRKYENKRLFLHHMDIGPTGDWGYPLDERYKDLFPHYSSGIFDKIDKKSVDIIFIDGRFRVACALASILECGKNEGLRILFHDFWNRSEYHIVLKYFNVLDRADSLAVFSIRDDIDLHEVKADYEVYKYNTY